MDSFEETIDSLILNGAIEITAIDSKTGEPLYAFTPKMKTIMPKLYEQHITEVNKDIMTLWEKGFLNIDMLTDNPIVTLSDKSFIDFEVKNLSKDLQMSLLEIKRLLTK
jgi:tRNA A-37 threonylcarbamoyl transferase component Bud32